MYLSKLSIFGLVAASAMHFSVSAQAQEITNIEWKTSVSSLGLKNRIDEQFSFNCKSIDNASNFGSIWGTDTYTYDSPICVAALHSNKIDRNGGVVTLQVTSGKEFYTGSTRNGVQSSDYGSYGASYIFVDAGTNQSQNNTIDIPSQGILLIELNDGTTQEINLNTVRSIKVQQ